MFLYYYVYILKIYKNIVKLLSDFKLIIKIVKSNK